MPKTLPYRKASGEPAIARRGWIWRRYLLVLFFIAALLTAIYVIAGAQTPAVLQTWVAVIFVAPILVAAGMLGIALTGNLARRGLFSTAAYPDLFRIVIALALGLGALALGMLLLGCVGLIEPFHKILAAPPHLAVDGYPWVPALLLLLAAGVGFVPTRNFLRTLNGLPFKKPIRRGDWLILLAAAPVAAMMVAAAYPPGSLWASEGHGYDVLEYHLELPREYAANNSTAPLPHNVYSYFPQNVEMLYLLTSQMAKFGMGDNVHPSAADGYLWGVYPCQFLHVILMLLAALALGLAPRREGGMSTAGRFLAVILFLAIPWTLVTGSLAYNEGGMMLFGILALGLALQHSPGENRGAGRMILIGIFLGLAVGCKMTAGIFFALPLAGILLLQGVRNWKRVAGVALLAGLVYLPWALRAAVYSGGNPLFPIASSILPRDGWTAAQSTRFIRGHSAQADGKVIPIWNAAARGSALWRESVLSPDWSPGYASIYRWSHETWEDGWWKEVGILWLIVGPAILLAVLGGLREKSPGEGGGGWGLGQVLALLLMLVIQVLAWMFLTHVQSRFLLPVAAPLALLVALGAEGLGEHVGGLPVGLARLLIVTAVGVQALCSVFLLLPETGMFFGSSRPQPIGQLFEREVNWAALGAAAGAEPTKDSPVGKVLLVGGITPLFDAGAIEYNTVFDKNWFADLLAKNTPAETAAALRSAGINDVVINWDEIARLRASYGYEDSVTPAAVEALEEAGLRVVAQGRGWVVLEVEAR